MAHELPYRYTIGLEVHVELNTATKMFCRCINEPFGSEPNTHLCPVCLGLPGTMPVPNREAVKKIVLVGKAIGSEINKLSKWDRKHYFYPDSPKGYQISQYDLPFCVGGQLALLNKNGEEDAVIRFERVHLEEDAGKLMHGHAGYSKVDLNRVGVPLIEMVTKPDLHTPEHARAFMQEVRLLVRTLGVSTGDMEKGNMRCDVNVSIQFEFEGKEVSSPITEIKNVNSTRSVERSIAAEGQRLYNEWMAGGPIRERTYKLTAGWDEEKEAIRINRTKEAANEYRYFPEPDLPPVKVFETEDLNPDHMTVPELPNEFRKRSIAAGIMMPDIEVFLADAPRLRRLEELASSLPTKSVANWLVNTPESAELSDEQFAELLQLAEEGSLPAATAKQRLGDIITELKKDGSQGLKAAAKTLGLLQEHDDSVVQSAIATVLAANPQAIAQFKEGKMQIVGFVVGQVMKQATGKASPAKVQEAVRQALEAA